MMNNRSKLLVDIANSTKYTALHVCEAQDLINYFDGTVEAENVPQINARSPLLQSVDVRNEPQREMVITPDVEVSFHGELLSTSCNLLSQSDYNYITDSLGDICNNAINSDKNDYNENVNISSTLTTHQESFTSLDVGEEFSLVNCNTPDALVQTPMPSPCSSFGDIVYDSDSRRESSPVLSDTTVRSSGLASSEYSGSSTPRSNKKKRMYVKKAIVKNRSTNKSNWIDVKRKLLVNLGKRHISRSGTELMGKKIKPPCNAKCRLKCFEKFDAFTRQKNFDKFWQLGDHSRQWTFIASNMKKITKKQWTQDSKRLNVYKFFLPYQSSSSKEKVMVCKTMFKNTFAVSNTFIQSAIDKYNNDIGMCSKDMRGCHQNHRKIITSAMKDSVIQHVKSFAPVESHYTRKETNKLYLDSELNFKKMYNLYLQRCKDLNLTENVASSVRQYKDIVNNELNIAFFLPKKDQCDICHANKNNTSPSEDDKIKHSVHMNNKKVARKLKSVDKIEAQSNSAEICTAMFDFQKINNTPHGEISVLYYKRKLSVYNFTIFDAGLKKGVCYMWDETQAKRGANEVASCLFSFITNRVQAGIKDFRFWSDNCAGQNRNRIVFLMYLHASKTFKIDVCHRFLEKGHTQNEADSVHALIEQAAKNKLIYVPDEWYTLVRWAKQNGPPYEVIEIDYDFVLNFKALLNTKHWLKDTNNEKICWNKIKEIKVHANQPDIIEFKYDLFEKEYQQLNCSLCRKVTRKSTTIEAEILTVEKLYTEPIAISEAKYKDLINLCDTMIIPQKYHNYYKKLKHSNETIIENEED